MKKGLLKAQKLLRVQESVSRVFATEQGLEDTLYRILKTLGTVFNWKVAIVWLLDDQNTLRYSTGWYVPTLKNSRFINITKQTTFRPGELAPGKTLLSKKPKLLKTFYGSAKDMRKEAAQYRGMNQVYLIPITFDKEVFGVMEFIRSKPISGISPFKETLDSLKNQIGQYIKRKQSDLKLELSEQKSRVLVELAPAIIYTVDNKGQITSLNQTVETITGIKESELIGKSLLTLVCPDEREEVSAEIERQRKTENLVSLETKIITKGNETLIAELKEKRVPLKKGSRVERIGIIRDVTERLLLEKQKDLWMGIATHELKSPLTSIKAFVQILQQKAQKKEVNAYLQRINDLSDEMASLISDLLDLTKIRSGTLTLVEANINLKDLVEKTVGTMQSTTTSHKINLQINGNPEIRGDRQRINQVLTNLLSNAVKYSPQETEITVSLQTTDDNTALLSVSDMGVGIAKKDLVQIFDLFYRASERTNRKIFGLGLGLFISKQIVKAHEGNIWAESQLGKGSTFYVELPLLKKQAKSS